MTMNFGLFALMEFWPNLWSMMAWRRPWGSTAC